MSHGKSGLLMIEQRRGMLCRKEIKASSFKNYVQTRATGQMIFGSETRLFLGIIVMPKWFCFWFFFFYGKCFLNFGKQSP